MTVVPSPVELEDQACPLGCSRADSVVFEARDRLHGLPGDFRIVKCRHCGLMRTNPRPTAATIGYYYPDIYGPYAEAENIGESHSGRRNDKSIVKRILLDNFDGRELPIKPPGRLLEIGCANGKYLDAARAEGWEVEGIEFSAKAASAAIQRGHTVQVSTVESATDPEEPYDAIVGWMVLEHLHYPLAALSKLRRWSHAGTYLVLAVPDISALEFRIFRERLYSLHIPNHLYHFTPETLTKLLAAAGWQVERLVWHKNPNNLLHSLRYVSSDRGWEGSARFLGDVASGRRWNRVRALAGSLLGGLRQSGRMTVWAKPLADYASRSTASSE